MESALSLETEIWVKAVRVQRLRLACAGPSTPDRGAVLPQTSAPITAACARLNTMPAANAGGVKTGGVVNRASQTSPQTPFLNR